MPSLKTFLSTLCCFVCFANATFADEQDSALAGTYGFSGIELFKLDGRAFSLVTGDFDSDGRTDVVAIDNRSSCLRWFRQRPDANSESNSSSEFVNDLDSDARFEVRQIPVDKQVSGLVSGDFNSDGRDDLAYLGAPDRLVIRFQPAVGKEWSKRWSVRLPDLAPAAWMLSCGDLNGDGLQDIAALGKRFTYIVTQSKEGMQPPQQLINTSNQLSLLNVADVNGDGAADLTYQSNEGATRSLCVRLQLAEGRIGPEYSFELGQPRSLTVADVDNKAGAELLYVDNRTGRLQLAQVSTVPADSESDASRRLVRYGIGDAAGGAGRKVCIGDIDGDGRNDAVVTDPENAQLLLYRQKHQMGLGTSEAFPGLLDCSAIACCQFDAAPGMALIQVSNKEAVVAVSEFAEGRISFPRPVLELASDESVIGMTIRRSADGGQELVLLTKTGRRNSDDGSLKRYEMKTATDWALLESSISIPADLIGSRGADLHAIDIDGDGNEEVMIAPEGTSKDGVTFVRCTSEESTLQEPLNLGINSSGALYQAGSDLLVARDAFARRMSFEDGKWSVADQFNAGESRAKIVGAAALNLDGQDDEEVVLVDTGVRRLRLLKKTDGLYRPWSEVELGTFNFRSTQVADLNGDGQPDLMLFGQEQFAVLYSGATQISLEDVSSWEADRDDAYSADTIAGDINGDGVQDLIVIDTSFDGVELLYIDEELGMNAATHFRIFEEKRLVSEATSRGTEPREAMVADVTGDGLNDLLLLCHDRLLLYPQDVPEAGVEQ